MAKKTPKGIFDSCVGGLSIAKAIHAKLPNHPLHYVADLAYSPYGTKTPELIAQRSQKNNKLFNRPRLPAYCGGL